MYSINPLSIYIYIRIQICLNIKQKGTGQNDLLNRRFQYEDNIFTGTRKAGENPLTETTPEAEEDINNVLSYTHKVTKGFTRGYYCFLLHII